MVANMSTTGTQTILGPPTSERHIHIQRGRKATVSPAEEGGIQTLLARGCAVVLGRLGSMGGDMLETKLYLADAVDWLKQLPDKSVDLVVTDPPYESLEKYRVIGTTTRLKHSKSSSNDWFAIFPNDRFEELLGELYRTLKDNTHCYIFCDQETMFVLKPIAEKVGFRFWKPIVWDKIAIGMGYHYRARYEFVLFFEKGKRKLKNLGVPDVLTAKRIRNGFPTQKPVELVEILISQSSEPGDTVVDPFAGSGTTLLASRRIGRSAWGTDISASAYSLSAERLAKEDYWKTEIAQIYVDKKASKSD